MYQKRILAVLILGCLFASCGVSKSPGTKKSDFIADNMEHAHLMLKDMLLVANPLFGEEKGAYPRTTDQNGKLRTTSMYDWTPGFFPGSLWYAYEFSGDEQLKSEAIKWTEKLERLQTFTGHHDLGFMMYCSYGNAYRLTHKEAYKDILIRSAKSLSTRFNATTGTIKSWNGFSSWNDRKKYNFPVIIDNMMNLEMLFFASRVSGDDSFRQIAIKHAETTMANHFRPDHSSYHVVCYDSTTGKVLARETAQGYADNSTWSRGQAWAIYGYTMVYRETKDSRFLDFAKGLADYFIKNPSLPADKIPLWDFNAGQPGFKPGTYSNANNVKKPYRDASAAAITASALLELSTYCKGAASEYYKSTAIAILQALGSENYRAQRGTNGNFIIKHCVGSIPHKSEIDVPLVYADYYFLEALLRLDRLNKKKDLFP